MSTQTNSEAPAQAGSQRAGWTLLALAIGFIMATLDITIVNVALVALKKNFDLSISGVAWIVDGYILTFSSLLLAGGALANHFGTKFIYLTGMGLFIAASLVSGLAAQPEVLIVARLVQGAAAAMFMPGSLTLLVHAFPEQKQRARAIALWAGIVSIASGLGPVIGGILVHNFGWRSIFLINIPLGLIGIVLTIYLVSPVPKKQAPLNIFGHLFAVLMLASLSYALIEGPSHGWSSQEVILAAIISVAALIIFLARERSVSHPILPIELFSNFSFSAVNMIGFFINFSLFGLVFLLSLFFQQSQGISALDTGYLLLPMMSMFAVANFTAAKLNAKFSTETLLSIGLIMAAAPFLFLLNMDTRTPYWLITICVSVSNLGIGIAVPTMTAITMQLAGRDHANIAAATLNANRQLGGMIGVAIAALVIQLMPNWNERMTSGVTILMLSYVGAWLLSWRFIKQPKLASENNG